MPVGHKGQITGNAGSKFSVLCRAGRSKRSDHWSQRSKALSSLICKQVTTVRYIAETMGPEFSLPLAMESAGQITTSRSLDPWVQSLLFLDVPADYKGHITGAEQSPSERGGQD